MNIAITWPKSKPLSEYVDECLEAAEGGYVINYRVPQRPLKVEIGDRCYVVYDGKVVGYHEVIGVHHKNGFHDLITGDYFRSGWYIERDPITWRRVDGPDFPSFRGFRYLDRQLAWNGEDL